MFFFDNPFFYYLWCTVGNYSASWALLECFNKRKGGQSGPVKMAFGRGILRGVWRDRKPFEGRDVQEVPVFFHANKMGFVLAQDISHCYRRQSAAGGILECSKL